MTEPVALLELTETNLEDPRALVALGMLVAHALKQNKISSLFLTEEGKVEVILPGELECDSLTEEEAVQRLSEEGFSDRMLVAYLKGRDTRLKRKEV